MELLSFHKHHVKRDPMTLEFMVDDHGDPVKGEYIRETKISAGQAEQLNASWRSAGQIYVLQGEIVAPAPKQEQPDIDAELEAEKKEVNKMNKDDLIATAENMGLDTSGTVKDLKDRIIQNL